METAFLPVMEQAEPMTAQQEIEWSRAGQMLYAEAGITTAHEGASHLPQFQTMRRASEAGANIIDVVAYPFITDVDKVLAEFPASEWGKYQNRFKLGGVKITLDGSPQGRTAFFTTPYLTGGPAGEKDWKGEPTFPQDLANKMVKKVYDMNVPLIVHTNGDAAIDAFLAAYELARAGDYSSPWNVTTIHTQFMRKDQIPKFVEYKSALPSTPCTPSTSPTPTSPTAARSRPATSARCAMRSTPASARPTTPTSSSRRSTR